MWVALLVALVMNSSSEARIGVQAAPEAFHSEAECKAAQASVEPQVNQSKDIKAYTLRCVEITKEEFKAAGKDA